jgi:hypothetical protein
VEARYQPRTVADGRGRGARRREGPLGHCGPALCGLVKTCPSGPGHFSQPLCRTPYRSPRGAVAHSIVRPLSWPSSIPPPKSGGGRRPSGSPWCSAHVPTGNTPGESPTPTSSGPLPASCGAPTPKASERASGPWRRGCGLRRKTALSTAHPAWGPGKSGNLHSGPSTRQLPRPSRRGEAAPRCEEGVGCARAGVGPSAALRTGGRRGLDRLVLHRIGLAADDSGASHWGSS